MCVVLKCVCNWSKNAFTINSKKHVAFDQKRHLKVDQTHLTDNHKHFNIQSKNIKHLIKISLNKYI